jgi:predicted metal-dependent phosphoesterase TrpH
MLSSISAEQRLCIDDDTQWWSVIRMPPLKHGRGDMFRRPLPWESRPRVPDHKPSAAPGCAGRADVHIHTRHSDGQPTVREVLEYVARHTQLDVIAITDHDTIEGALEAAALAPSFGREVIVGEEITSLEGHILGLFLQERIRPGLSAVGTVAAIHEQGGLAIAAHPFIRAHSRSPEVGRARMGVGAALRRVPFDGVEVINSFPLLAWANMRARRCNARYGRAAEVGGSDAHVVEAIGKGYTSFAGSTAADFAAAIRAGSTSAHAVPYGPRVISAYISFARDARAREGGL